MKRIDIVYAFIVNEDKTRVMMVQNRNNEQNWTLPGGTVELGETLEQALIREVKEEAGVDIAVYGVLAVNEVIFEEREEHYLLLTFRAEIVGGREQTLVPDEISAVSWIELERADLLMPFYEEGLSSIVRRDQEVPYFDEGRVR